MGISIFLILTFSISFAADQPSRPRININDVRDTALQHQTEVAQKTPQSDDINSCNTSAAVAQQDEDLTVTRKKLSAAARQGRCAGTAPELRPSAMYACFGAVEDVQKTCFKNGGSDSQKCKDHMQDCEQDCQAVGFALAHSIEAWERNAAKLNYCRKPLDVQSSSEARKILKARADMEYVVGGGVMAASALNPELASRNIFTGELHPDAKDYVLEKTATGEALAKVRIISSSDENRKYMVSEPLPSSTEIVSNDRDEDSSQTNSNGTPAAATRSASQNIASAAAAAGSSPAALPMASATGLQGGEYEGDGGSLVGQVRGGNAEAVGGGGSSSDYQDMVDAVGPTPSLSGGPTGQPVASREAPDSPGRSGGYSGGGSSPSAGMASAGGVPRSATSGGRASRSGSFQTAAFQSEFHNRSGVGGRFGSYGGTVRKVSNAPLRKGKTLKFGDGALDLRKLLGGLGGRPGKAGSQRGIANDPWSNTGKRRNPEIGQGTQPVFNNVVNIHNDMVLDHNGEISH